MTYDYRSKKVVAVIASHVEPKYALNVVGHLAIAIGAYADRDLMGRSILADGSGQLHLGISKYPIIITKVKAGTLKAAVHQAKQDARILVADFPKQMLSTEHDDELAASLAMTKAEDIEYLGAILFGPSEAVDGITRKFSLWQ
jgi:hypothetical protein